VRVSADHLENDTAAEREPLSEVLARSAAELADLADRTERLQDVMADLVQQCAALGGDATQDMQALDWIAQHLEGLASFLAALAEEAAPGWRIETSAALDALSLAELAHRLRGGPSASSAAAAAQRAAAGDMELF
jgi:hypothetical protein